MIVEQYVHTLISTDSQFAPTSQQITHFFDRLSALGAAPLNSELLVLKPSGRLRSFTGPLTGETKSFPAEDRIPLKSTVELASTIEALQQYRIVLDGHGPPLLPPFTLYSNDSSFTESYGFSVHCCLKAKPVSMSDLGDQKTGDEVQLFGEECRAQSRDAFFRHPVTGEVIKVANACCARFWVEFEFGKWLLPNIGSSLDILDPAITRLVTEGFGFAFAQGFHHV